MDALPAAQTPHSESVAVQVRVCDSASLLAEISVRSPQNYFHHLDPQVVLGVANVHVDAVLL